MNVLYQKIVSEIHEALFETAIETLKKDRKTGLKQLKQHLNWKLLSPAYQAFVSTLSQAVNEGWSDEDLHGRYFEEYTNQALSFLRFLIQSGKFKQDALSTYFDMLRANPRLRSLTEMDFYRFVAYTACST